MNTNRTQQITIEDRLDDIENYASYNIIQATNEAEEALLSILDNYFLSDEEKLRVKSMIKNIHRIKKTLVNYGI